MRLCSRINILIHSFPLLQNIELVVLPTDILEVDIRDKFSVRHFSLSHFLGRAKAPVHQFVRSDGSW